MLDTKVIDLGLSLLLYFLLLSLLVSALNEWFAVVVESRSRSLRAGLELLVGAEKGAIPVPVRGADGQVVHGPDGRVKTEELKIVDLILNHPLVRSQAMPTWLRFFGRGRAVNRIPTDLFPIVLLDALRLPGQAPGPRSFGEIWRGLLEMGESHLSGALLSLAEASGNDMVAFKRRIRDWYIEQLDAVSGWYKRKTQRSLLIISALVALALNADTVRLVEAVWNDDTIRTGLSEYARQVAAQAAPPAVAPGSTADEQARQEAMTRALAEFNRLRQASQNFHLPIFWHTDPFRPLASTTDGRLVLDSGRIGWKALGLLLTVLAVSMGAPFYYDLLQKVVNVRLTGDLSRSSAPQASPRAPEATEPHPDVA